MHVFIVSTLPRVLILVINCKPEYIVVGMIQALAWILKLIACFLENRIISSVQQYNRRYSVRPLKVKRGTELRKAALTKYRFLPRRV